MVNDPRFTKVLAPPLADCLAFVPFQTCRIDGVFILLYLHHKSRDRCTAGTTFQTCGLGGVIWMKRKSEKLVKRLNWPFKQSRRVDVWPETIDCFTCVFPCGATVFARIPSIFHSQVKYS